MWRVDRASGEDHFALGIRARDRTASFVLDRDCAAAVEYNPIDLRFDNHLEIGPLQRRPQIGARCAGSPAPAARLLTPADAATGAGRQVVDVLTVLEADLLTGLDHRRAERRPVHL